MTKRTVCAAKMSSASLHAFCLVRSILIPAPSVFRLTLGHYDIHFAQPMPSGVFPVQKIASSFPASMSTTLTV